MELFQVCGTGRVLSGGLRVASGLRWTDGGVSDRLQKAQDLIWSGGVGHTHCEKHFTTLRWSGGVVSERSQRGKYKIDFWSSVVSARCCTVIQNSFAQKSARAVLPNS